MAVVRIGSNRSPRSRPARAANSTGAYGGRKVVVPSSAMSTPRASAMIPEAITPEVLPWSWAVPIVVYRLTCSTDRRPAPVARRTSPMVASRCRSTNRVSSGTRAPSVAGMVTGGVLPTTGTDHSTAGGFSTHSAVDRGSSAAGPAGTPSAPSAAEAASRAPATHASKFRSPAAVPATRTPGNAAAGRNAPRSRA